MSDDVTHSVRELYEAFPYPERMPEGASDPYLDLVRGFATPAPTGRQSFLDAGCGTGVNLLGGATLYPHFDVYGCDINRVALADIEKDIERYKLSNASVKEIDLSELPSDLGPEHGFDVIFCTGVLHHMTRPEVALKRLAERLAPQGVLRLMVYSERGRADLYRFARVASKLWTSHEWSLSKRVEMARGLMGELANQYENSGQVPPPLRGTWSDANTVGPAEFADRYLHPHDEPYTFGSLRELIDGCRLRFLDWFEPRDWSLNHLLPDFAASPEAPKEFWTQVELIEELFERPRFDMYLVGPKFKPRQNKVTATTLLSTNPQLFFEQLTVRGNPLAQAGRLRTGPIEPVDRAQGRLLTALARRFACLAELCEEWGESLDQAHLERAQGLVDRGFLFRPHPVE